MAEDHVAKLEEAFVNAKVWVKETEGWSDYAKEGEVVMHAKKVEGVSVQMYRARGPLTMSAEQVMEKFKAWEHKDWQKFDSDITQWEVKEKLSDDTRLLYQVSKLPWPLWSRDMCCVNGWRKDGDNLCYLFRSVKSDKAPEKPKDFVRCDVRASVFYFEPKEGGGCTMTRIVLVDPAGNIPASVVNATAKKLIGIYKKVEEQCK